MSEQTTALTPAEQQLHKLIGEAYQLGVDLNLKGPQILRVNLLYMLAIVANIAGYSVLDEKALEQILHEYNTNPTLENNLILQLINCIELIENTTRSLYNERTVSDLQEDGCSSGIID